MLANYRLCRCNVVIEKLLPSSNHRLCRCSVLIEILMLVKYRLHRCSVVIEKLLLSNYRLCRCSVLIEMLLLASYRLCRFRLVIGILLKKIDIIVSSEILCTFTKNYHRFWNTCQLKITNSLFYSMWKACNNKSTLFTHN